MLKRNLILMLMSLLLGAPSWAQSDHDHDHQHDHAHDHDHETLDFADIDEGWAELEYVAADIRAAIKAGNLEPLHDLSARLHGVADGLRRHADEVPRPNRMRFTSSLNQLRAMSDRIHDVHEANDMAAAERMAPQLDGVVQLLMVSAEGR